MKTFGFRSVEIVTRKVKTKAVEVQTSEVGLSYQWNRAVGQAQLGPEYGLSYMEPVSIASHTVSPDALEGEECNTSIA